MVDSNRKMTPPVHERVTFAQLDLHARDFIADLAFLVDAAVERSKAKQPIKNDDADGAEKVGVEDEGPGGGSQPQPWSILTGMHLCGSLSPRAVECFGHLSGATASAGPAPLAGPATGGGQSFAPPPPPEHAPQVRTAPLPPPQLVAPMPEGGLPGHEIGGHGAAPGEPNTAEPVSERAARRALKRKLREQALGFVPTMLGQEKFTLSGAPQAKPPHLHPLPPDWPQSSMAKCLPCIGIEALVLVPCCLHKRQDAEIKACAKAAGADPYDFKVFVRHRDIPNSLRLF